MEIFPAAIGLGSSGHRSSPELQSLKPAIPPDFPTHPVEAHMTTTHQSPVPLTQQILLHICIRCLPHASGRPITLWGDRQLFTNERSSRPSSRRFGRVTQE
jgi:hypothetical protein